MSNGDKRTPTPSPSLAYYDFYKTNGSNTTVYFDGASMTRQEFADEADINVLMKRYERTGVPPPLDGVEPAYVDFTAMPSGLMDTMAMLNEAESAFMQLPAVVRKEFDNSAFAFVDYASDPANLDQMRAWGLAPPKPAEPAVSPPAGSAPPEAPKPPGGAPELPHTPST